MPYIRSWMDGSLYHIPVGDFSMPAHEFMRNHVGPFFGISEPVNHTVDMCIVLKGAESRMYFDYANRNRPLSDFVANDEAILDYILTPPTVVLRGNASAELPTNSDCSICLESFSVCQKHVLFWCHHRMHAPCYERYRQNTCTPSKCPLCRE